MLETIITVFHIIFAVGLTATVLAQSSKSAGLSGAFGGGGGGEQTFSKKKGSDELLSRASTTFAILFIVTSLILVYMETQ